MAVAKTGNTYSSQDIESGEGSIGSITVPADADIAIVVGGIYNDSEIAHFDQINWDGDDGVNDFTLIDQVTAQGKLGENCDAFYMLDTDGNWPGSGAGKTLWLSFSEDPDFGGTNVVLFFLSGVDAADAIGTKDAEITDNDNWQSADLGTGANDMAIICGSNYGAVPDVTPTGANQTEVYQANDGNQYLGVGYEVGEIQPSLTCNASYFAGIAFAINAVAVGANAPTGVIYGPLHGPLAGPI